MNFFTKNKFVFWLLVFLVAINLSALVTFGVFYFRHPAGPADQACGKTCRAFSEELSLSPAQARQVDAILAAYRSTTEPLSGEITNCRVQLLGEIAKPRPDTNLVNGCVEKIALLQKQIQKASVGQYLELKKICTPDQCRRLSSLYFELYGCQGKGMCREKGSGKGMMHRGGHGGKCMDSGR